MALMVVKFWVHVFFLIQLSNNWEQPPLKHLSRIDKDPCAITKEKILLRSGKNFKIISEIGLGVWTKKKEKKFFKTYGFKITSNLQLST
jgi:hypothetical protein